VHYGSPIEAHRRWLSEHPEIQGVFLFSLDNCIYIFEHINYLYSLHIYH
jgi:hypothetical protein